MSHENLCFRCFSEKPIREKPCPSCGYKYTPYPEGSNCLTPGTMLNNRYIVGLSLGIGGFGITYKCFDTKIGGICAIKEYFPANLAMRVKDSADVYVSEQNREKYQKIMKRFVEEGQMVRKLNHPNIITIYDNFNENQTAYYVMEYCDGIDLRRYSNNFTKKLEYQEGMNILFQIMNGLEYIHSKKILHRDIAPDNIYVTSGNLVKILDFGAARNEMDQLNRNLSIIVKVGYAPIEQYGRNAKQGPYTDIYALGATFYHLFTARIPDESTQRVAEDSLVPLSKLRPDLPDNLKYCIEKAMEITPAKRISSIGEMKAILGLGNVSKNPQAKSQAQAKSNPPQNSVQKQAAVVPRYVMPSQEEKAESERRAQAIKAYQQQQAAKNAQLQQQRRVKQPINQQSQNRNTPKATSVQPSSQRQNSSVRSSSQSGQRAKVASPAMSRAEVCYRAGAHIVDFALWAVVYYMALFGVMGIGTISILLALAFPAFLMIVDSLIEILTATTPGKAIFKMTVRGKDNKPLPAGKIVLRNIIKMLNVFVWIFAKGNDLLHDSITDSMVCMK